MGQAVVHFEVVGKDVDKLQSYYADLFGWNINSDNPMNYGMVDAKDNKTADGSVGIGGGVGQGPDGYGGDVHFFLAGADGQEGPAKGQGRRGEGRGGPHGGIGVGRGCP